MDLPPTDAELWALLRADDREAWGALFDRHSDRVYRFGLRLVGDAADAEDLLADTFLEVWRARRSFVVRDDSALPILVALARRVAQKQQRSKRRRQRVQDRVERDDVTGVRRVTPDAADDVVLSDEAARRRAWLRREVAALPEACRDVYELVVYAEFTQEEVARLLGIPVGTVKSRASRARHVLAQRAEAARSTEHHLQDAQRGS